MIDTSIMQPAKAGLWIGIRYISQRELLAYQATGRQLTGRVIGLLVIEDAVSPELATATLGKLQVYGMIVAHSCLAPALTDHLMLIGVSVESQKPGVQNG